MTSVDLADAGDLLFVYGTLLPGLEPSGMTEVVRHFKPLGKATIRGRLYDLGAYPGVILASGDPSVVHGHVFRLPEDTAIVSMLDNYEGCDSERPNDSLYLRRRVIATMQDGTEVLPWVYEYNRELHDAKLVKSGDYIAYRHSDASGNRPDE